MEAGAQTSLTSHILASTAKFRTRPCPRPRCYTTHDTIMEAEYLHQWEAAPRQRGYRNIIFCGEGNLFLYEHQSRRGRTSSVSTEFYYSTKPDQRNWLVSHQIIHNGATCVCGDKTTRRIRIFQCIQTLPYQVPRCFQSTELLSLGRP